MRRPLFAVCLCLVMLSVVRLGWKTLWGEQEGAQGSGSPLTGKTLTVTGRVYQKEEQTIYLKDIEIQAIHQENQTNQKYQTTAAGLQQNNPDKFYTIPKRNDSLICKTEENIQNIPLGSRVLVSGIFQEFPEASNPGEFHQKNYYKVLQVAGKLEKGNVQAKSTSFWPVREGLYQLKCAWKERLFRIFPEKEASIMSAMLLGDKTGLDKEIREVYKRNGIIHILSISGLHITMIGMVIYKILRKGMGLPVWVAALAGGLILVFYGILTGLGVSACRAIGMYLIRMLGEMWGRSYDMLTALGIVGAVTVLGNPLYLTHAGFLLSYGAVLGIGLLTPLFLQEKNAVPKPVRKYRKYRENRSLYFLEKQVEKLWSGLKETVAVSGVIALATLPVMLWFYYEVPVYAIFLNLLVLPFMKLVMGAGMLAMLIPGLGWLGKIDCLILGAYEWLCRLWDCMPFHTWNPGKPEVWQIAVYYLLLFSAVWWKRGYFGKRRFFFITAAIAVLSLQSIPETKITFLDVGQGDGICVQTASGKAYLFDCGSSSRSKVGSYVLFPFLKHEGISHLDGVFVSHPDADHVNGIVELLKEGEEQGITVGTVILPDIREEAKWEEFAKIMEAASLTDILYIGAGDTIVDGKNRLTCLHPPKGYTASDANAYSQCFYLEFGERDSTFSLLLTGDVEEEGEALFLEELEKRDIRDVTILKAAHHGSRNSTSLEMLQRLRPSMTLISCGKNNRYGHPHKELLERLEASGTETLQTPETGAVTVTYKKGRAAVETYFRKNRFTTYVKH